MEYTIIRVFEHVEVFDTNGRFIFSADSYSEAVRELETIDAA